MPLPKMPTKQAALLSPKDYPKAGKVNQRATNQTKAQSPIASKTSPSATSAKKKTLPVKETIAKLPKLK